MDIQFNHVFQKDIEWKAVLDYFNVHQAGNKLCVKPLLFYKIFLLVERKSGLSDEDKVIEFNSYGRHLLSSQIAEHYERIFNVKVRVNMVSDELWGSLSNSYGY